MSELIECRVRQNTGGLLPLLSAAQSVRQHRGRSSAHPASSKRTALPDSSRSFLLEPVAPLKPAWLLVRQQNHGWREHWVRPLSHAGRELEQTWLRAVRSTASSLNKHAYITCKIIPSPLPPQVLLAERLTGNILLVEIKGLIYSVPDNA